MAENYFDQFEDAAVSPSAASTHVQAPENFFDEEVGQPAAAPGKNETIVPKTTPGRSWRDDLMDGVSIDNAREAALAKTRAEKANPRMETPQEASFWGSMEHALGNQNIEAFANSMDHIADWSGDLWWSRKAQSMRDSLKKDGSSYKPVYESYSQIGGMKDFWGYVKETIGNQVGVMAPSILGASALGGIGASQGGIAFGKTGAMVGGTVGSMVGAAAGNAYLHVSDMREALKREGVKGEDLVKYTNMGAAILVGLDSAFPAMQAMKLGGFARKSVTDKVAKKLVQNLVEGGKMRTAAEFIKVAGREVIKDAVLLEVPTELAQEALTELGAKKMAGKNITAGDVQKFATETAPEVVLRTIIGAGGMALPGAGAKAYRDVRDAKAAAVFPGDTPSTGAEATEADGAPPPAPVDGTPAVELAAGQEPQTEDPSRDPTPKPAEGAKGTNILRFIQAQGGLLPSGELDALDAQRYPGLINRAGKSADEMREILVEAGYIEESGPDQPAITTPDDVYNLVQRAISGERIVPIADQQADSDFFASLESKNEAKELEWAEKTFVLPEIERYDEEAGDPILSQLYRKLAPDERIRVIDAVRRGEDAFSAIEEIVVANVDNEAVQAMVAAYGPNPELLERIRNMIAQQEPDLLHGFDEMVAQFPTRRPRVAREPARRAGDPATPLVRSLGGRLKSLALDAGAFEAAVAEMERDRKILKEDAYLIATDFLGKAPKKGTKASYFQAIRAGAAGQPALAGGERADQLQPNKMPGEPAVPVSQSVRPEAIVSLIDGSKHNDLRSHLKKQGLDVEDYARTYRLDDSYPLVAPNIVAQKHNATRQTETYEQFSKRFTIGAEKVAGVEAVQKAIQAGDAAGLDAALPKMNKRRLDEMAKKLGISSNNPAKDIGGRFIRELREAEKAARTRDIMGGTQEEYAADAGQAAKLRQTAIATFMQAADPNTPVQAPKAQPQQPGAPAAADRDVMGELIKLANSKTPRDEWGAALGLGPYELNQAITQAVQAGILAYDKRGVARRAPMDQRKDAKGILAEFNALLEEAMPTEISKYGQPVPVTAAVQNWSARANMLIQQLKTIPLAEAQALAAKMVGRKVGKTEIASRPKIIALVERRLNAIADSRLKAGSQGSAAFIAPGVVANENVMLTPEAEDKAEVLQSIVDQAMADILPANVRPDVEANIQIARLAREDELFALRSSLSDTLAEEGDQDGQAEQSSSAAGREGRKTGSGERAPGTSARPGQGVSTLGGRGTEGLGGPAVQRIVRQESASLRSDGSVFAGRPTKGPRTPAGRDTAAAQRPGKALSFAVEGFQGRVIAEALEGADLAQGNVGRLLYRVFPKSDRNLREDAAALAEMYLVQHSDGAWEIENVEVSKAARGQGVGKAFYAAVEADLGIRMSPSGFLSPQGHAFWKKRSPESVKWHVQSPTFASEEGGYYFSPRKIKDELERVGAELRNVSQGIGRAARLPEKLRNDLIAGYRKERGELIKLWSKLPVEARAATASMFSLRGFYSPVLRAAEALKQDRGSGEQFLKAILATPGVKADEVRWIGLESFLKGKEKISKNALMAWVKANQTKMDERELVARPADVSNTVAPVDVSVLDGVSMLSSGYSFDEPELLTDHYKHRSIKSVQQIDFPKQGLRFFAVEFSHILDASDPAAATSTLFDVWREDVPGETWVRKGPWASLPQAIAGLEYQIQNSVASELASLPLYAEHRVPGSAERYREVLLRVPELGREGKLSPEASAEYDRIIDRIMELEVAAQTVQFEAFAPIRTELESLYRMRDAILVGSAEYESAHFNTSEIVHIRMDDRTLSDGRRVLFVHEVQSDLHQRGRKSGYSGDEAPRQRESRLQAAEAELSATRAQIDDILFDENLSPAERNERAAALKVRVDALEKLIQNLERSPMRDAPFKGDLYLELALKRILQEAIEGGYDAISWARPEQIAIAVGAQTKNMAEQYDKKIRRFYEKYTKPWGGKVTVESGVAYSRRPPLDSATNIVEAVASSDGLRMIINAADNAPEDFIDNELRDAIGAYEDDPDGFDAFDLIANLRPETTEWLTRVWQEMRSQDKPQPAGNQMLAITPKMRAIIPATGQPLYSLGSSNNDNRILGRTDPYAETISISMAGVEAEARASGRSMAEVAVTTARHEALEFFLAMGVIAPDEWAALQRAALKENWIEEHGRQAEYAAMFPGMGPNQLSDLLLKEAVMEKYGRYRAGEYQPKGLIGRVFKRLGDLFDRLVGKIRGEGFQTWEDIFQKVDQGELRRRYEEIYGRPGAEVNTQAMIRAGVLPDARGIARAPGQTRAPRQTAAPQTLIQRALPRDRPLRALSDLMNDFKRASGMPLRTGHIDPALSRAARAAAGPQPPGAPPVQARGQYNGVARVRVQVDFDTFAHEAGHHLERMLGGRLRVAMAAFSHELNPLAGPVAGQGNTALSEGYAEFFRRYLTNEVAARQAAPGFYQAFENLVESEDSRLFWAMQDIQDEYDRFLMGDPLDRGAAQQTVLVRPTGPIHNFLADAERDGFVSTVADRLYEMHHGFIQSVFDNGHGWWMATRALLDEISRQGGARITLAAADNPAKLLKLTSHTQAWAQQDLKEGIALRSRPNGGGVSMHQVLATAFGGAQGGMWNEERLRAFGDYLIARRAIGLYVRYRPAFRQQIIQFVNANPQLRFILTRLPQNINSDLERPPTAEALYEHLNRLLRHEQRNPQFRQAAELYYQFNKDMIELLYEKGLISDTERAEYQQDRDYAPFQRNMSDRETVSGEGRASKRPGRARDTVNKYDVYHEITGSMRDIINPIQSTVQTMYEIRLRAAINDTLVSLDRLARQAGQAGNEIFERLPPTEARAMQVNIREQLRQAARAAGMNPTDTAIMLTNVENQIGQNVVTQLFTQQQISERGEKIVWFFENGKPIPAQLPDGSLGAMMFEGLTAVGQRNMGVLMDAMATTAAGVRLGVTLSFGFMIRNIITDSIASWVNSPYARPVLTQVAGMREIVTGGRYLHLYNRYAGMMGGAGYAAISDQSLERDIDMLRQRGFHIRRPRSFREFFSMIFQAGEFSETATRVGIFRNAMRSAMADGMSQFEAAIEAGHYAHDVMDFSQHGSKTEFLRRIIPFFNAALQGLYRYSRTLTAANDYGNLIQIWQRHSSGQPLSQNERRALGQAGKAWMISVVVLGGISMIFSYLGADDDDMKEVPDSIRATHWRVSINGILYLLPKDIRTFIAGEDEKQDWLIRLPKPFEMAWFANAVERAWDGIVNSDPTAAEGYIKDFFTTVIPPHSVPSADILYGFLTGKDMYSGNDIVPYFEKGSGELERSEQFGPYTSWLAKQLGGAINISPYYADFLIRNLFASVGSDTTAGIDSLIGEGPKLSIGEYPVARRFTYNAGKTSESLSKFYNMTTEGEGLSQWFWNTFTDDARSFHSAANTYGKMTAAGGEDSVIASEFLSRINPDQRAYAILSEDFKGSKGRYRNLHPMLNASEGVRIANAVMKEVVSGTLIMDKGKRGEERKPLDREQMRFARNEIGHIRKGMAQNALQIIGVEGWADQKLMDIDARLDVLKAGAPDVHAEIMRRLKKEKFQDSKHLAKVWPKVKERLDANRKEADLSDLYGPVVGQ